MKNHKKFWMLTILMFSISFGNVSGQEKCIYCDMSMYFTGKTKTEWGHIFYLYKCPSNHEKWVKQEIKIVNQNSNTSFKKDTIKRYQNSNTSFKKETNNSYQNSNISNVPKCPVCGMNTYFTGETYTEWGKLFKIYKCSSGHMSTGKY